MTEYHGVGLAAPQVHEGCASSSPRSTPDDDDDGRGVEPIAVINPEITSVGVRRRRGLGRLPEHPRHPRARAARAGDQGRALDRNGERIELRAHDFPARVIQHETDHLDGILFFDRMTSLESLTFLTSTRATGPRTSGPHERSRLCALSLRSLLLEARSACSRSSSTFEWSANRIASAIARWPARPAIARCIC